MRARAAILAWVLACSATDRIRAGCPPEPEPRGPRLVLEVGEGRRTEATTLSLRFESRVSGLVARTRLRQVFRNPLDAWLESVYLFPLPEDSAVDHLRVEVGDRLIEGVVLERLAARQEYEQAVAEGRRAGLVEQVRENLFTANVANVGPHELVVVELEYQQLLRCDSGRFSIRYPTALTPRYSHDQDGAIGQPDLAELGRVTPAAVVESGGDDGVLAGGPQPAGDGGAPALSIEVAIEAGLPILEIGAGTLPVEVRHAGRTGRHVSFAPELSPARDVELSWTVERGSVPRAATFVERGERGDHLLVVVVPPDLEDAVLLDRDVTFVLDVSGSMAGASIVQAKAALELAIRELGARDRFNVIAFSSTARALWDGSRDADAPRREEALAFVSGLGAGGGTEMEAALELAFSLRRDEPDRVGQIVFLTDGAVSAEDRLSKLIAQRLGNGRLFTVGIGPAPNTQFMSDASAAGRGTFTAIGSVEEVEQRMGELFAKLRSPVLTDIVADWHGAPADAWPRRIPDLYAGQPLRLVAALPKGTGRLTLTGRRGGVPWRQDVDLAHAALGTGLGTAWAREKIAALTKDMREGRPEDEVRPEIVSVALEHRLVSRYTSLVAVERSPARPVAEPLETSIAVAPRPDRRLPSTGSGWRLELAIGLLLLGAGAVGLLRPLGPRRLPGPLPSAC